MREKNQLLQEKLSAQKCKLKEIKQKSLNHHYEVQNKKNFIIELSKQFISLKKVVERNKKRVDMEAEQKFKLPFILIKFQP